MCESRILRPPAAAQPLLYTTTWRTMCFADGACVAHRFSHEVRIFYYIGVNKRMAAHARIGAASVSQRSEGLYCYSGASQCEHEYTTI